MTKGTVYCVGAGPGDPGCLTIRAKDLLNKAECVLFDQLVHPTILTYCQESAEIVYVGKQKGKQVITQDQINHMLLRATNRYNRVVRLKGGDPFIFGRVGEEMAYLTSQKIPFEIVPGVSSAIAVPGYSGIPLTHRNKSRSVAFVTGTLKRGEVPLTLPVADTLVFLMGLTHCEEIVKKLITQSDFTKKTPVAIISNGTLANQSCVEGTLETIIKKKNQCKIETPAMLVVGDVVGLMGACQWRSHQRLAGKRVVLLRPRGQSDEWVRKLGELGAEVVHIPLIKTVPMQTIQAKLTQEFIQKYTMICFTSANGVNKTMQALLNNKTDSRGLANKTIIAVGTKTNEALQHYAIQADLVPEEESVEGILNQLPSDLSHEKILCLIGKEATDRLQEECKKRGAKVHRANIYATEYVPVVHGHIQDQDYVVFTSGSTVSALMKSGLYKGQDIYPIVMGKSTQKTAEKLLKGPVKVAKHPTIEQMIKIIESTE